MISPAVGFSSRRMQRPDVVLPQPLSPTSPKVSPRRTVKSIPSTAFTSPTLRCVMIPSVTGKYICSPLTSSRGLISVVATVMPLFPSCLLFVQPYRRQVLVDKVARTDLPALHIGPVRNGPIPPQGHDFMRLLVEHIFL